MFVAGGVAESTQSIILPDVKYMYLLLEVDFYLLWTQSLTGSCSEPADNQELQGCSLFALSITAPGTSDTDLIPQIVLRYPYVSTKSWLLVSSPLDPFGGQLITLWRASHWGYMRGKVGWSFLIPCSDSLFRPPGWTRTFHHIKSCNFWWSQIPLGIWRKLCILSWGKKYAVRAPKLLHTFQGSLTPCMPH